MKKSKLLLEQFQRYANNADMMTRLHSTGALAGYGNSELNCLDCIGRMRRPNAARIAEDTDMTRSAISKILRKLMSKDTIISYQLPENQKEIYYRLTPLGREIFKAHRRRHQDWEERDRTFFESLPGETLDAALGFMNTYNGFLEVKLAEEMDAVSPGETDGAEMEE